MDGVTSDIPPPKATMLSARRLSPKGGQTEFASTEAAYKALPADERAEVDELRVVHSLTSSMLPLVDIPTAEQLAKWGGMAKVKEHPLVWTQASGRRSLLIGTHADRVVGWALPEGRALLQRLLQWASQPDFTYRHQWQEGDLVIWHNPSALHRVIPYDRDSGRTMHRTTIAGVEQVH
jgi:alpha-ketoglutarate-dependent taurine dioxygenase